MVKQSVEKILFDRHGEQQRLSLNERLALISLISVGARRGASDSPLVADLFDDLGNLVDLTVSGARIDRLRPDGRCNGFRVFEITSSTGESLGRLNLLYLKKPIPCYYLVYVEVAPPFRKKGLGSLVLESFRDLLIEKSAVGILDNIIPIEDPTFDIYRKLDWIPVDFVTESTSTENSEECYMIFVPPSLAGKDLKDPVRRLVHHLKRKRASIDMRDNEFMVSRTIEEFKDLYSALLAYFRDGLMNDDPDPLMRFMFTRYVTKLLGFRRRIGRLLGYTGGESLAQIVLDERIRNLPSQSYAPRGLADSPSFVTGDRELWLNLPETLKTNPARFIESLPNYRRPSLMAWLNERGLPMNHSFSIGEILDLGFDPTRLKEITIRGTEFIFERMQTRMIGRVERQKAVMNRLEPLIEGLPVGETKLAVNPPLLVVRDRGNGYVLRRKIQGIHWEEAVEQLQINPRLKSLNESLRGDRIIGASVKKASEWMASVLDRGDQSMVDGSDFFVSWNLDQNRPTFIVDLYGAFPESVWIA